LPDDVRESHVVSARRFLLAVVLFTCALLYRRADAFLNPQFWAEDGTIFFMQQDRHDDFIPFQNYAGYIHLVPRSVAYAAKAGALPYEYVPAFYNGATYLLYIFYCGLIWRFAPLSEWSRLLMIVSLGIVPTAPEVYMCLTNFQWFAVFGLVLLLFEYEVRGWRDVVWLTSGVTLAALSGPFSTLLSPLVAYRLWKERGNHRRAIPLGAALLAGVTQLLFLFVHFRPRRYRPFVVPEHHLLLTAYTALKQVFLFDHRSVDAFRWPYLVLILPVVAGYIGLLMSDLVKRRTTRALILLAVGINVVANIAANWPFEWVNTPFLGGERYFFIPFGLCCWYAILCFDASPVRRWTFAALLCGLFLAHGAWTKNRVVVDLDWKGEVKEYRETGDLVAPINPDGWFVWFKARPER
jgi:hypothetical protein